MIGVIANPRDHQVVREFFELFKTPWDFYRSNQSYDALLVAGDIEIPRGIANLVLVYSGKEVALDAAETVGVTASRSQGRRLSYEQRSLPLYGDSVTFSTGEEVLTDALSIEPAMYVRQRPDEKIVRVGYDLFGEVRTLLTIGQPVENADSPTLDLHIELLRDTIVSSGVSLVEIPPIPSGYKFLACLTHDVDHPYLRQHRFDHTMLGFLYRATFGSLTKALRGRLSARDLLRNWIAVLKLPLVHAGLAQDPWARFDRYAKIENGQGSTFFVIPFKNRRGEREGKQAPKKRAASYGASDVSHQIKALLSGGSEIGVHGIDAWRDPSAGVAELDEIRRTTGLQEIGVRMHWLYFDEDSPAVLEDAGFDYDSTCGFNGTVGYRAGTAQVFKPLRTDRLLELPLHIMDTALFYPTHLDLAPVDAMERVTRIIDRAVQSGGCVTVNWHDRSIAPERLWGGFYANLVHQMESKGAWISGASQAVAWFRKRRSARFERVHWETGTLRARITLSECDEDLPEIRLRVHQGLKTFHDLAVRARMDTHSIDLEYQLEACSAV